MMRSWAEISPSRLRGNLRRVRERLSEASGQDPPPRVIAVVKADAYGHGMLEVAEELSSQGVNDFAVAQLEEAARLRRKLPRARILVLGGIMRGEEEQFQRLRLTASVFDERPLPPGVRGELKVDTGMTRLGIPPRAVRSRADELRGALSAVFSHFACADCDPEFTRGQLRVFLEATEGLGLPRHLCNSAGLAYPEAFFDAVRVGLALYGIDPSDQVTGFEPVLAWKTRLLSVRKAAKGSRVGYGATFKCERPSIIGILPVGYADGYKRLLSGKGQVEVRGRMARVAGRVSMDLTAVDLTEIPGAQAGDEATLISSAPAQPHSAASIARKTGTIPYEVLTSIGPRVPRRWT